MIKSRLLQIRTWVMCLVPMARLMASSMRLYSVRRWVPWRIRCIYKYNNKLVSRQRLRDPQGSTKKWNSEDGLVDRRPTASALPCMYPFEGYVLSSAPGGRFERSGAPVCISSTSYNSIVFCTAEFWILPSSADCRLCICSLSHPLRRLCKCFSHASDVNPQHVRARASPSSSRSPRHSLLQIVQIAPSDAESSVAWNAVENLSRLHLPFWPVLCSGLPVGPSPFALPS
jgi:hypothetical protein